MLIKYCKISLLLFLSIILFSCSSSLNTISEDVFLAKPDKFNPNTKIYVGSMIDIIPTISLGSGYSQFRLHFEQTENNETWMIRSVYSNKNWIFVEEIKFLINNDIFDFKSLPNPFREVGYPLGGTDVFEENYFIVTPTFCKSILNAKQISVRLIGDKYYKERDLSKEDIRKLKNFVKYIDSEVLTKKIVLKNEIAIGNITNIEQKDEEINLNTEYIFVDDINKFKILLNKYNGQKIKMTLSLTGIITDKIAWFTDETFGIISVQYDKSSSESLEYLASLKKGEKCIVSGIVNPNLLGNPGIIADTIKETK